MITRWNARLAALRRAVSRSEWAVWLLGLPRSKDTATEPGLILVQIDGLARSQLERAMRDGRTPFLSRLMRQERHRLHSLYSGLPSSTPAFQAELFYGEKTVVPAFSFRDRASGELVRMYYPEPAQKVEERVREGRVALLDGGSAYCDVYSGGAPEAHFCASTIGWGGLLAAMNPLKLAALIAGHGWSLLRVAVLMVVELFVALVDCARGVFSGRELIKELTMVPARVAVSIMMRELVVIGASMDVARGLPVVHLNLLGYDEQAHRRGPSSAFAHWTLKGIDHAIWRIWHSARRSMRRDYDVWVYSDHGQEETVPYPNMAGRSIDEAVREAVESVLTAEGVAQARDDGRKPVRRRAAGLSAEMQRSAWLGRGWLARLFSPRPLGDAEAAAANLTVAAMGPVAHVYLQSPPDPEDRRAIAERLVSEQQVPMALVTGEDGTVTAITSEGCFELPHEAAQVLGHDHPFLDEAARDLVALCRHPDAGHLVLCGWRHGASAISFAWESGAHAGAGPEETHGFALLPVDARLPHHGRTYLRALDLREAALDRLGRAWLPEAAPWAVPRRRARAIRLVTYNVHYCKGLDGKLSPARIARVIAQCEPDVVALQELDVGRPRTGDLDQAQAVARALDMDFHFHPTWRLAEERQGDAVLSRVPMKLVRAAALGEGNRRLRLKSRGALWVEIDVDGLPVQLVNTHLDVAPGAALTQIEELLGPEWLGHPECKAPVVLCGDFNSTPRSRAYSRAAARLSDAQVSMNGHRPRATWFGRRPMRRIDHVFISPEFEVERVEVPNTTLTHVASDHLPLVVELRLP